MSLLIRITTMMVLVLVWSMLSTGVTTISAQTTPADDFQVQHGAETVGGVTLPAFTLRAARDLPTPKQWQPGDPIKEIPRQFLDREAMDNVPEARGFGFDPLAQKQLDAALNFGADTGLETTIINQDGGNFSGVNPSDTIGDVGVNFYVQMINTAGAGSEVLIIDKVTGVQAAFFNSVDLAAGSGTGCGGGQGDPVVVFDQAAANGEGRWLLAEFTGSSICVYVSQTQDPTGNYFVYEFGSISGGLPDYFKAVVWPDAYYVGANEGFQGGRANYAYDRVNMLLGNPARPIQVFSSGTLSGFAAAS